MYLIYIGLLLKEILIKKDDFIDSAEDLIEIFIMDPYYQAKLGSGDLVWEKQIAELIMQKYNKMGKGELRLDFYELSLTGWHQIH